MFITAPIVNEDISGDSIYAYPATFGQGAGAAAGGALATNPVTSIINLVDKAFEESRAEKMPGAYVLSPDEANNQYGDLLGPKFFTKAVSPGYAKQVADNKRLEIERSKTLSRAPSGMFANTGYFLAGLGASAIDPINLGSAFIPVVGEERFAALAASTSMRTARLIKGAAEGAVGAAIVEPLVYAGAQTQGYDYGYADSFMNVAFGTVLGGGLHLAGGEIKDAWLARKSRIMAETGRIPSPTNLAEAIDNLSPPDRAAILSAAIGQMANGNEINLGPAARAIEDQAAKANEPFSGLTREKFIGESILTSDKNAAGLKPKELESMKNQAPESFLDGKYEAKFSKEGAVVFNDKGKAIASFNFGENIVTAQKYRRQGIAEELVYQWNKRFPGEPPPTHMTKKAKALYEKVWARIERERSGTPEITAKHQPIEPKPELEIKPQENTIVRAAALPEDLEQSLADLDAMLQVEKKAGTLSEGELAGIDAANEAAKQADAGGRGLLAAASCVFRKA